MLPSDRTRGGVASFIARASRADSLSPQPASGLMSAIVTRPIHASRIDRDSTRSISSSDRLRRYTSCSVCRERATEEGGMRFLRDAILTVVGLLVIGAVLA